MTKKPGRMYRQVTGPAYSRREYISGVPASRIQQFEHGDLKNQTRFEYELLLRAVESCQIRHTSLEAARISANKYLMSAVGTVNYYLKIIKYPHHILREHKMATGAGADRISSGMSMAFGRPVGTAARVKAGEILFLLRIDSQNIDKAKEAFRKATMKLPTACKIEINQIKN